MNRACNDELCSTQKELKENQAAEARNAVSFLSSLTGTATERASKITAALRSGQFRSGQTIRALNGVQGQYENLSKSEYLKAVMSQYGPDDTVCEAKDEDEPWSTKVGGAIWEGIVGLPQWVVEHPWEVAAGVAIGVAIVLTGGLAAVALGASFTTGATVAGAAAVGYMGTQHAVEIYNNCKDNVTESCEVAITDASRDATFAAISYGVAKTTGGTAGKYFAKTSTGKFVDKNFKIVLRNEKNLLGQKGRLIHVDAPHGGKYDYWHFNSDIINGLNHVCIGNTMIMAVPSSTLIFKENSIVGMRDTNETT